MKRVIIALAVFTLLLFIMLSSRDVLPSEEDTQIGIINEFEATLSSKKDFNDKDQEPNH